MNRTTAEITGMISTNVFDHDKLSIYGMLNIDGGSSSRPSRILISLIQTQDTQQGRTFVNATWLFVPKCQLEDFVQNKFPESARETKWLGSMVALTV